MKNLINSCNGILIDPSTYVEEKYREEHPDVTVVDAPAKGCWLDFDASGIDGQMQRVYPGNGVYLFSLANEPGTYFATGSLDVAEKFAKSETAWAYAAHIVKPRRLRDFVKKPQKDCDCDGDRMTTMAAAFEAVIKTKYIIHIGYGFSDQFCWTAKDRKDRIDGESRQDYDYTEEVKTIYGLTISSKVVSPIGYKPLWGSRF